MNSLVSIIIPVFNVEKYISKCVDSVINQKYRNIEIIIIDDGSTDKSAEICKEYANEDNRIKIISQKNAGLSCARNVGIENSSGDYIMFVDGDDFISASMVMRLLEVSHVSGADYVCSESMNFMDGDDESAKIKINGYEQSGLIYEVYEKEEAIRNMFYQKPSITGAYLKIYKRELFDKIKFPEKRYYEDLATTYKFMQEAQRIVLLKEKHYAYRIRKDGIMNQKFNERKMDCIWVSNMMEKDFLEASYDMKKAVECAAFRVNRIVFVQTPLLSGYSNEIYMYIKKYRRTVLFDESCRKYERLIALAAFGGKYVLRFCLIFFSLARTIDIKRNVGRDL